MGHIRATLACWSLVFVFLEVVCLEVLAVAFRADSPDLFAVDVFIEGIKTADDILELTIFIGNRYTDCTGSVVAYSHFYAIAVLQYVEVCLLAVDSFYKL